MQCLVLVQWFYGSTGDLAFPLLVLLLFAYIFPIATQTLSSQPASPGMFGVAAWLQSGYCTLGHPVHVSREEVARVGRSSSNSSPYLGEKGIPSQQVSIFLHCYDRDMSTLHQS